MAFSKVVGDYLNVWEGHSQIHGIKLQTLVRVIQGATLDEINTEYNVLSRQNLWVEPLIDVFYDELLRRIMTAATFVISTSWTSINDWLNYPFIYIRVGFEDAYALTNSDGTLITIDDDTTNVFAVTNDSFSDKVADNILRLLINKEIVTTAQIVNNSVVITSIENKNDPTEKISLSKEVSGNQTIKEQATIYELDEFNIIRRMLDGLRNETFDIVDPYEQRLRDYEDFKEYSYQTSTLVRI